ncbi:MAG: M23 family peptidase, partial [Brevundimonas sp.]|nr:M23 family peptidase [Brevundimonas sp.]
MIADRRGVLIGSGALLVAGASRAQEADGIALTGRFIQGGHAVGRTWPRALVFVDGESLAAASADGVFIVGFDRDAPGSVQIEARAGGRGARRTLDIAPGRFPSTRVDGLPPSTV